MAAHEKETHDCIICASALGTNGGTLTLLCGESLHCVQRQAPLPPHGMQLKLSRSGRDTAQYTAVDKVSKRLV